MHYASSNWVTNSSKYLLPVLQVISLMMLHRCGIILFVALPAQSRMIIYAKYIWVDRPKYRPPRHPPHMHDMHKVLPVPSSSPSCMPNFPSPLGSTYLSWLVLLAWPERCSLLWFGLALTWSRHGRACFWRLCGPIYTISLRQLPVGVDSNATDIGPLPCLWLASW